MREEEEEEGVLREEVWDLLTVGIRGADRPTRHRPKPRQLGADLDGAAEPSSRKRGHELQKIPLPQRSVSKAPGRGPFRGRRPGALRNQQAEEVAIVVDLDRASIGGRDPMGR